MAFPQVQSVTITAIASATTAHSVSLPATVTSGDLLVIYFNTRATSISSGPSGWTEVFNGFGSAGGYLTAGCFAKVADGSEGGSSVTVTSGTSAESATHVYRITSWEGTLASLEIATSSSASKSSAPNPVGVTASWGSADNLFISALMTAIGDDLATAYPTNYTNGITTQSDLGGNCAQHSCRRELAAASDDPGAYSLDAANTRHLAITSVIRPAAAAGGNRRRRLLLAA